MGLEWVVLVAIVAGVGFGIYARAWWLGVATAIVLAAIIPMQLGSGHAWAGYGYFSIAFLVYLGLPAVLSAWAAWIVPRLFKELAGFGRNIRS